MFHGEWLQDVMYGAPAMQFLASVIVVTLLGLLLKTARRLRRALARRYTRNLAEAVEMVVLAGGIVGAASLLANIWAFSFVFEQSSGRPSRTSRP